MQPISLRGTFRQASSAGAALPNKLLKVFEFWADAAPAPPTSNNVARKQYL
jgi:hypothetical protein